MYDKYWLKRLNTVPVPLWRCHYTFLTTLESLEDKFHSGKETKKSGKKTYKQKFDLYPVKMPYDEDVQK